MTKKPTAATVGSTSQRSRPGLDNRHATAPAALVHDRVVHRARWPMVQVLLV